MDTPNFTAVFGFKAPALNVLKSLQRAEPISIRIAAEPSVLEAMGGGLYTLPSNGLAEALARLKGKCPHLYK